MSHSILIVDDEQHILHAIKRCLRREDYDIQLANGGEEALRIMAEKDIALIICDQRMPGMSGAEVLAESVSLRPDAYRITLTGYTDLDAAQKSINAGQVNQFLLKPWDDQNLRHVVAEGLCAFLLVQDNRRLQELTRKQNAELEAWNHKLEEQVRQRTEELRTQNEKLVELQGILEGSLRDTVGVLASTLEMASPALGIHSKRVGEFARHLGSLLEVDEQMLRDIEFASHLHDIGKITGVQAAQSPHGQSSSSSRRLSYAEAGYTFLARVHGFEVAAQGVHHQNEKYDGSGSPDRLKKKDIPLISRIIAIANAYDEAVFISAHPTRPLRKEGRRILLAGRAKVYDPALVDLFLEHLDEVTLSTTDSEVELSPRQLKEDMILSRDLKNIEKVLLLKTGTVLTPAIIERIRKWTDGDLLLTGICIKCTENVSTQETEMEMAT